jgi:hypothetical protein
VPDWLSAPLRGMTYLFLWTAVIGWSIAAPIIGIFIAINLLQNPPERILVPLSLIATIYITLRGARLLIYLSDLALNG